MNSTGKALLIVEESDDVANRIINSISGHANVSVILAAGSYSEAIILLAQKIADIVVIDIHLENKKGFQLLKLINADYRSLKIVAIGDGGTNRETCMDAGADFFIDRKKELNSIPLLIGSFV